MVLPIPDFALKTTKENASRILVIGSEGMVGSALMRFLRRKFVEVYSATHKNIEIRNSLNVADVINMIDPQTVFLCAALTHVDYCEDHPEASMEYNLVGPTNVLNVCGRQRRVVFFSSSYVFDGSLVGRGYYPSEKPSPINIYGKHKAQMETRVLETNPENLVIRTVGVVGKEIKQKNFAYQILGAIQAKREVYVPLDQEMNPVWSDDLAKVSYELLNMGAYGIYHVAGNVCKSKYEFAVDIADTFKFKVGYIVGKFTEAMDQKALRPLNGCLDVGGLFNLDIPIPQYSDLLLGFSNDY